MKTLERLAEEYATSKTSVVEEAFLAGYKTAQEHAHAALEEAEAKIQELEDQLRQFNSNKELYAR